MLLATAGVASAQSVPDERSPGTSSTSGSQNRDDDAQNTDTDDTNAQNTDAQNTDTQNTDTQNTDAQNTDTNAQDTGAQNTDTIDTTTPTYYSRGDDRGYESEPGYGRSPRVGFAVALGGGVDDFAGSSMRDATGIGGSWDVRVTVGTKSYVAGEASYIGSAQRLSMGFGSDAMLVGNGAQGALRVNGTIDEPIQPFAYGGVGWRHYSIANDDSGLSRVGLTDTDDVMEFPVGIGVAAHVGGLTVDVRGEYRFSTSEDLVLATAADTSSMDRWGIAANVGVELE